MKNPTIEPARTVAIGAGKDSRAWQEVFGPVERGASTENGRRGRRSRSGQHTLRAPGGAGALVAVNPRDGCRGGCGKPMPPGQKCVECATAAVDSWLLARSRRLAGTR